MYKKAMQDAERRSKHLYQEQLDASNQINELLNKIAHLYDVEQDDKDTLAAMRQVWVCY